MRQSNQRKSAPGVKSGKVQKKNKHTVTADYYVKALPELVFHRVRPRQGYRHFVTVADVKKFISIIPEWEKLSVGLRAIEFSPGTDWHYGTYNDVGVLRLDAWTEEKHKVIHEYNIGRDKDLLDLLNVSLLPHKEGLWAEFETPQIVAFQLLGTFLHELGHHVDRMNTKSKREPPSGEKFAEEYETAMRKRIWRDYCRVFGF